MTPLKLNHRQVKELLIVIINEDLYNLELGNQVENNLYSLIDYYKDKGIKLRIERLKAADIDPSDRYFKMLLKKANCVIPIITEINIAANFDVELVELLETSIALGTCIPLIKKRIELPARYDYLLNSTSYIQYNYNGSEDSPSLKKLVNQTKKMLDSTINSFANLIDSSPKNLQFCETKLKEYENLDENSQAVLRALTLVSPANGIGLDSLIGLLMATYRDTSKEDSFPEDIEKFNEKIFANLIKEKFIKKKKIVGCDDRVYLNPLFSNLLYEKVVKNDGKTEYRFLTLFLMHLQRFNSLDYIEYIISNRSEFLLKSPKSQYLFILNIATNLYKKIKAYDLALICYNEILKIKLNLYKDDSNNAEILETYNEIAYINKELKNYDEAYACYKKKLDVLSKSDSDNQEIYKTYFDIIRLLITSQNYNEALNNCDIMLDLLTKNNASSENFVKVYDYMAYLYKLLNNHEEAIKYYEKALNIQQEICEYSIDKKEVDECLATLYTNIAKEYVALNDAQNAINNLNNAVNLYEKGTISIYTGTSNCYKIAKIYSDLGEHDKALNCIEKGITIFKNGNNKLRAAEIDYTKDYYVALGEEYKCLGEYEDALKYFFEALKYAEQMGGVDWESVNIYRHIANVYLDLKNKAQAEEYMKKYVEIRERMYNCFDEKLVKLYIELGDFYHEKCKYEKNAIQSYFLALRVEKEINGDYLNINFAMLYKKIGYAYLKSGIFNNLKDLVKAPYKSLKYLYQALDIYQLLNKDTSNYQDMIDIYEHIGDVYMELNKTNEALKCYEEAIRMKEEIYKDHSNNIEMFKSYKKIVSIYTKLSNQTDIIKYLEKETEMFLEISKTNPELIDNARFYNLIASVNYDMKNYETAIEYYSKEIATRQERYELTKDKLENNFITKAYEDLYKAYENTGSIKDAKTYFQKELEKTKKLVENDDNNEVIIVLNRIINEINSK